MYTACVVPDMRRAARKKRRCRRCPFCAPSGRCLDRTLKSGRCGDWIWFVRYGKRCRRPYARPTDPRTLAQLRSRGCLSAASKIYSRWLTDEQQDACIAAGAKLRTRPRLGKLGRLRRVGVGMADPGRRTLGRLALPSLLPPNLPAARDSSPLMPPREPWPARKASASFPCLSQPSAGFWRS